MHFWKKIFKPKEIKLEENFLLKQKEEYIDYYENSWVDNDIPKVEKVISDLIYDRELSKSKIDLFLDFDNNSDFGGSEWSNRGELNFPGPFYTGETDTCGTGIIEAPNNVVFNEYCMEFVMIQPRNKTELLQVWNAGAVEVFGSYYCDGNKYWTIDKVKNWWARKDYLLECLENEELIEMNCNQEKRYRYYLENFAEIDLRKYCFFLDNGSYPNEEVLLPEI